jgi:hypothetical protein
MLAAQSTPLRAHSQQQGDSNNALDRHRSDALWRSKRGSKCTLEKAALVAIGQRRRAKRAEKSRIQGSRNRPRCKATGKRTKAARQRKKPEHQVLGPQSTKEGGGDSSYYSESFVALQ